MATQASSNKAIKLRLEAQTNKDFNRVYNQIIEDNVLSYEENGTTIDANDYADRINAVSFLSWIASQGRFSRFVNKLLNGTQTLKQFEAIAKKDITGEMTVKDVIRQMNLQANTQGSAHMQKWVGSSTSSVVKTNNKDLLEISSLGLSTSEFRKKLKERFGNRIPVISSSIVNESAEHTKQTYLSVINSIVQNNLDNQPQKTKTWIADLDDHTRPAHADADGQTRLTDEPYLVGGQLLKRPRDTSLGATLDNVINCRCDSILNL